MVKYIFSVISVLIALTNSAIACMTFRGVDLKYALQAEAVFLGKLLNSGTETVKTPGGYSYHFHRLDFAIERLLSGNQSMDHRLTAYYSSRKSGDFGQIGDRYIVVLGGLEYQNNMENFRNKHFVQTAICGGNVPYVFKENSEPGRALKMIFNKDGVSTEVKADILSRFVGLYGQTNF